MAVKRTWQRPLDQLEPFDFFLKKERFLMSHKVMV